MMLLVGLCLVPFSIYGVTKYKDYKNTSKDKMRINLLLLLMSLIFIVMTFIVNKEPFQFEISEAADYLLYTIIIFIFSPVLWINGFFHIHNFFRILRTRKNTKAKNKKECLYYRDKLNKISPSILLFTRTFDIDTSLSIPSSILKLKLGKNIVEKNKKLEVVNKKDLLNSDMNIISLIETNNLDVESYKENVINDSINLGLVKKYNKGKIFKLLRIIAYIALPICIIVSSIKLDDYVFTYYKTYAKDGIRYVKINDVDEDIGDIHFDHPNNFDDYYHGVIKETNEEFYDKSLVKVNKFKYKKVKTAFILHTLDGLYLFLTALLTFVFIYLLVIEIKYFNKGFRRTIKGQELLNNSYALKNFLEDFSDIKNRKEKELILWDYYLVYASVLGVNVKINDELIKKYVN